MAMLRFTHRPLIMGIVNVTPDSFSGDGVMQTKAATEQALQMLQDGADCLDIGGESSRPGAVPVSADEEIKRVIPVITALRKACGFIPAISIDTVKAEVADAALQAGADIINDISALQHDPAMAKLAARKGCAVILMHNRSEAGQTDHDAHIGGAYAAATYGDVVQDVKQALAESVASALSAGIAADKIILDPGLGFGKTVAQNLQLIKHLAHITELACPVLVGPSRKSFIGKTLDLAVDERLEGTAATVALAAFLGADIIRVHDVKFMARVAKMAAAVKGS